MRSEKGSSGFHAGKSLLVVAAALVAGCYYIPTGPIGGSRFDDRNGPVTVYVGNESRLVDPVDIRVEIDGQLIAQGWFGRSRRNPSHFEKFTLSLPSGKHQLKVTSVFGKAALTEEFQTSNKHWIAVFYHYRPHSRNAPEPRHFTFDIRDERIMFE